MCVSLVLLEVDVDVDEGEIITLGFIPTRPGFRDFKVCRFRARADGFSINHVPTTFWK